MKAANVLVAIKLFHTVAWAFFVGCILGIPLATHQGNFALALALIAFVLFEVVVLLVNRWSCPLTGVAARYTNDRQDNFDIFLPLWIARYNKQIFGALFVGGLAYTIVSWWAHGSAA